MIESISAVTLVTRDMRRAVRFYETLGFRLKHGGPEATFTSFEAGTGFLNLITRAPGQRLAWWGRTDQGPWVIEVGARSIGGLCARALRFGAGIGLEDLILSHVLGLPIETMAGEDKATGVMMIPIPQAGVLESVGGIEAARRVAGVDDVTITIPKGHEVVPLPEGNKYLGFIFARGDSPEAVEEALRDSHHCLRFQIDPRADAE